MNGQPQQDQGDETHLFNPYLLNGPICRAPKVRFMMDDIDRFLKDPLVRRCRACESGWKKHSDRKDVRRIAAGRSTE